jgi:anaphase-promoting complex subunit 1
MKLQVCDAPSASCSNQPNSTNGSYFRVDQLVSTFSANPSLIAFAKLCSVSWKSRQVFFLTISLYLQKSVAWIISTCFACNSAICPPLMLLSSNCRCNSNFQEFCSQVLYECMSKDRPSLLQVSYCRHLYHFLLLSSYQLTSI